MFPFNLFGGSSLFELMVTSLLRSALLVAATLIGLFVWRRGAASVRSWIGVLALSSTLLIPLLAVAIPAWSVAILPVASDAKAAATFNGENPLFPTSSDLPITGVQQTADGMVAKANHSNNIVLPASSLPRSTPISATAPTSANFTPAVALGWSEALLMLWAIGSLLLIGQALRDMRRVVRLTRAAQPIADPNWVALLADLRDALAIRRSVTLVRSEAINIPMTWGLRHPVIVLPIDCAEWSDAQRRIVLLHELAHIARWDYLTQWLTLLSCAINWFNPLVWRLASQLSIEREQACDDQVLNLGTKSSDYAIGLLSIADALRSHRTLTVGLQTATASPVLAMVRGSELAVRIARILDNGHSRLPLNRRRSLSVFLLVAITLLPLSSVQFSHAAQSNPIPLTLAVTDDLKSTLENSTVLTDFETAYPGVSVTLVNAIDIPVPSFGLTEHFAALQKYASSADVLEASIFGRTAVTPQATRAGYLLDLAPLITADASLKVSDYEPHLWPSYQWDAGTWALPLSATVAMLSYDKSIFDKAGLNYPDGSWTLADFVNAVKKLSVTDTSGHVTVAGFANTGKVFRLPLFRSLIGSDLVDEGVIPNLPKLDSPTAAAVRGAYHDLEQQGFIGSDGDVVPMIVSDRIDPQPNRGVSLLPGGKANLMTDGFAVSRGTQHADLAYALAKFLTTRGEIVQGIPANLSLKSAIKGYPPSVKTLIDLALANALTPANLRYYDYLDAVYFTDNVSAEVALQKTAAKAVDDANTASAKKATLALTITEPVPPTLAPGKIALKFDMSSDFITPNAGPTLPNKDAWDRVIADFTANDPQVGYVNLMVGHDQIDQVVTKSDCFYLPSNSVPTAGANGLLALDSYLTADAKFDRADLIGNVLTAVQRDDKTYALPLAIAPMFLRYDAARFSAARLPTPMGTWTVEAFTDALRMLKANTDSATPFTDNDTRGTALLVLMAAYGGLPIDYRSDPPVINFTDPATVAAMRNVLDLAKGGFIKYAALGNLLTRSNNFPDLTTAIYPSGLNAFSTTKKSAGTDPNPPVLFPTGHQFNGVAYNLGAAYITAATPNADACYRFISTLAKHPELFALMPARTSQLADPTLKSSISPDVLALYNQFATLLKDLHTVAFPMPDKAATLTTALAQHWLFEAFDSYVLNNGDLDAALKDAETYAKAFITCTANLPVMTTNGTNNTALQEVVQAYLACAVKTDSRLKAVLGSG